jgi:hypothetical protein
VRVVVVELLGGGDGCVQGLQWDSSPGLVVHKKME